MHPQRNVIHIAQMINENESDWERQKKLAKDMQRGENERQFGDHEHMAKDVALPSDKEFNRYMRSASVSDEKGMDSHISQAADTVKNITNAERKHHEKNSQSPGYKGWLNRTDRSYGGGTAKEHINRVKQDAFYRFAGANSINDKEELARHIGPFNKAFNDATRRHLEHPV